KRKKIAARILRRFKNNLSEKNNSEFSNEKEYDNVTNALLLLDQAHLLTDDLQSVLINNPKLAENFINHSSDILEACHILKNKELLTKSFLKLILETPNATKLITIVVNNKKELTYVDIHTCLEDKNFNELISEGKEGDLNRFLNF